MNSLFVFMVIIIPMEVGNLPEVWDSYDPYILQTGDSSAEELANATQVQGPFLPIVREKPTVELVKVTDEMKSFKAYYKLRLERTNQRHHGARLKKAAEAEKEDKK